MLIGYARVSTDDQKLDLQMDALAAAGVDPERVYRETMSGTRSDRPQLAECLRAVREGDTLVVWRLDRLARSLKDLIRIGEELTAKGVAFRSLQESIDTNTATGRMIFHVMGALAQFERDLLIERTRAGLRAAHARGKRGGRPKKITPAKLKAAKALMADDTITTREAAEHIGVSRATLCRELAAERKRTDHAVAA